MVEEIQPLDALGDGDVDAVLAPAQGRHQAPRARGIGGQAQVVGDGDEVGVEVVDAGVVVRGKGAQDPGVREVADALEGLAVDPAHRHDRGGGVVADHHQAAGPQLEIAADPQAQGAAVDRTAEIGAQRGALPAQVAQGQHVTATGAAVDGGAQRRQGAVAADVVQVAAGRRGERRRAGGAGAVVAAQEIAGRDQVTAGAGRGRGRRQAGGRPGAGAEVGEAQHRAIRVGRARAAALAGLAHAAHRRRHAQVVGDPAEREAAVLLQARQAILHAVDIGGGVEQRGDAEQQDGADQQGDHQLDKGEAALPLTKGGTHHGCTIQVKARWLVSWDWPVSPTSLQRTPSVQTPA